MYSRKRDKTFASRRQQRQCARWHRLILAPRTRSDSLSLYLTVHFSRLFVYLSFSRMSRSIRDVGLSASQFCLSSLCLQHWSKQSTRRVELYRENILHHTVAWPSGSIVKKTARKCSQPFVPAGHCYVRGKKNRDFRSVSITLSQKRYKASIYSRKCSGSRKSAEVNTSKVLCLSWHFSELTATILDLMSTYVLLTYLHI